MALSADGDTAACCWADAVAANAATVAAVIRALLRIVIVASGTVGVFAVISNTLRWNYGLFESSLGQASCLFVVRFCCRGVGCFARVVLVCADGTKKRHRHEGFRGPTGPARSRRNQYCRHGCGLCRRLY